MALQRATPAPGMWTYEDLAALPDDGTRYEIIEGELLPMTGVLLGHAIAFRNLVLLLAPLFERTGFTWFASPFDVFFNGADPVQPDLLALAPGSRARAVERGIEGPPDFIVEILSPSTKGRDRLTKRALYERAGVREYWLVDPEAGSVEVLALRDGNYRTHCLAAGDQPVASVLLPAAGFAASAVFTER
jgi:Uma2 family endonuclease